MKLISVILLAVATTVRAAETDSQDPPTCYLRSAGNSLRAPKTHCKVTIACPIAGTDILGTMSFDCEADKQGCLYIDEPRSSDRTELTQDASSKVRKSIDGGKAYEAASTLACEKLKALQQ
ncbi:hypothetical protein K2X30_01230 [bacterium]|jgi:hypothetical protein|nr:hypothetical protein [bacterium]